MPEAVQRLVAQVDGGADALVVGTAAIGHLMSEAAPLLATRMTVVSVADPAAELSLSNLIAQISGCTDLGGQDDAVLQLGFQRLTGPGRTILLVAAPLGISRSALRYLQHTVRQAPNLSLVMLASAPLDALLDGPDFSALRLRLRAHPPIAEAADPAPIAPPVRRSRPFAWVATIVGGAAVLATIAWFGYGATQAAAGSSRSSIAGQSIDLARVPVAVLSRSEPPALAPVASPDLVVATPNPAPDRQTAPLLAMSGPPLPTAMDAPVLAALPALPPLAQSPVSPRRSHPRVVRTRPRWQPRPAEDPVDSAWDTPYEAPPPGWPPVQRRGMRPYYGPAAIDGYGRTMFGYSP